MDFKLPQYTFDGKKAVRNDDAANTGYKKIITDVMHSVKEEIEKIGHHINNGKFWTDNQTEDIIKNVQEKLADIQQALIETGNLIEQIKGENTQSVKCIEKFCDTLYMVYQGKIGRASCRERV